MKKSMKKTADGVQKVHQGEEKMRGRLPVLNLIQGDTKKRELLKCVC